MVPEAKRDGNFANDEELHGESYVWSTAQTQYGLKRHAVDVWF